MDNPPNLGFASAQEALESIVKGLAPSNADSGSETESTSDQVKPESCAREQEFKTWSFVILQAESSMFIVAQIIPPYKGVFSLRDEKWVPVRYFQPVPHHPKQAFCCDKGKFSFLRSAIYIPSHSNTEPLLGITGQARKEDIISFFETLTYDCRLPEYVRNQVVTSLGVQKENNAKQSPVMSSAK